MPGELVNHSQVVLRVVDVPFATVVTGRSGSMKAIQQASQLLGFTG
jgi:hypothetical protein